ncbi:MAG: hypothetical protein K5920_11275 [Bacteroidales bacterium]|nr:hypothetical protein [Bacteroidales bacterium]
MRYLFAKAETLTPQRPSNMASGIASKIVEIRNENIKRCMGDTIAHRQQYIDTVDGVIYYDDAKAENVNATWFTFENIVNPVIWIVGGSCHNNYSELIDTARKKVKTIISIGNEQEGIELTFRNVVKEIYHADSIEKAVSMASILAEENDLVLFSPACKDSEMNYEERGKRFVEEVSKL